MLKESLKLDKKTRFSDIFNDDEDNRWWWRCDVLRNAKQMQCIDHQQQNIFYRTRKFSRRFFLFATKEMRSMFGLHERVYFYNKSPIRMHQPAYSKCATVNKTIRRIWREIGRHTVHQLNYKLWFAKVNKIQKNENEDEKHLKWFDDWPSLFCLFILSWTPQGVLYFPKQSIESTQNACHKSKNK